MSDSLRLHELQHARPPCPSPTPRFHPNSCPSSWWYHPAISSSVVPFSSFPTPPSIRVFSNDCLFALADEKVDRDHLPKYPLYVTSHQFIVRKGILPMVIMKKFWTIFIKQIWVNSLELVIHSLIQPLKALQLNARPCVGHTTDKGE